MTLASLVRGLSPSRIPLQFQHSRHLGSGVARQVRDVGNPAAIELSHHNLEHQALQHHLLTAQSTVDAQTMQYDWIPGAESLERYASGGYHPIHIAQLFRGRYRIVDKLGFGCYSTVWLTLDVGSHRYVALKVGVADSLSQDRENRVLRELTSTTFHGQQAVPAVLDEFEFDGPNGKHRALVTTPARCSVRQAIGMSIFNLQVARALIGGLTLAVAQVHSRGYVHGGKSIPSL
jgi:hypothetical protein